MLKPINRLELIKSYYVGSRRFGLYQCSCGTLKGIRQETVISGKTVSCGCFNRENARRLLSERVIHGCAKRRKQTPEYRAWGHMKGRCYNPKDSKYYAYGARGIKVCDRWLNSFENFLSDMGKRPSAAYSLDRINVDGNYEPGNCRWATAYVQCHNRRISKEAA